MLASWQRLTIETQERARNSLHPNKTMEVLARKYGSLCSAHFQRKTSGDGIISHIILSPGMGVTASIEVITSHGSKYENCLNIGK